MNNPTIIVTSPNQKVVKIQKTESDKEHTYGIFNCGATCLAASTLSDRAFKLYAFLNMNQDGFTFALSPAQIAAKIGMKEKKYREAVKELTDAGYLVQQKAGSNWYCFYELPGADITISDSEVTMPKTNDDVPSVDGHLTQNDGASVQIGYMTQPIREDNLYQTDGEILHNTTSHNTVDNTQNNSSLYYTGYITPCPVGQNNIGYDVYDEENLPF